MKVIVSEAGGFPSYPYRKVVVLGDRAEVAEFACEGEGSENIVYHEDLVIQLRERCPDFPPDAEFTAGWLAQSGDEATLHLHLGAPGLTAGDHDRFARALGDWSNASGVRKLTIADMSSRRQAPEDDDGEERWGLPA